MKYHHRSIKNNLFIDMLDANAEILASENPFNNKNHDYQQPLAEFSTILIVI